MPTISLSVKLDISRILTPGHPVSTHARAVDLYSEAPEDSEVNEYFVIDADGRPCGIVTKRMLASAFGGLYGYSMHSRSSLSDIMSQNFISVDEGSSLTDTASKAMSRSASHVYDAIAVTRDGRYIGQITIKDLLLSLKDAMVEAACDVNPLTKLPGNRMIDSTIEQLLGRDCAWSVAYIDIDNFKAFNDAYGFAAGDQIILDVAECMKSCFPGGTFLGHVGGDDFVAIFSTDHAEELLRRLCLSFHEKILPLYTEEDRKRGYIISKDRFGTERAFPIATLSIALMSGTLTHPSSVEGFSKLIAKAKKKAKASDGDAIALVKEDRDRK